MQNKREFQQIAINHSSDIDNKDSINLHRKFSAKQYSFLAFNAILT